MKTISKPMKTHLGDGVTLAEETVAHELVQPAQQPGRRRADVPLGLGHQDQRQGQHVLAQQHGLAGVHLARIHTPS
jgi:hypothetical protein